jgi:MFS family permease
MRQIENPTAPGFWGKLVLVVGASLTVVSGAGVSTAIPAILANFEAVPGASVWVSLIITLPALFVVVGGPISGYLTDRIGRKPVLVGSILLSGIAGTGAFFINNLFVILVTRALLGLSVAGAMTANNALIADYFSGQQRAKFMGYQSAVIGVGLIVFLPIGGLLADISWRHPFLSHLTSFIFVLPALFAIQEPLIIKPLNSPETKLRIKVNSTTKFIFVTIFVLQFAFITIPIYQAYYLFEILEIRGFEVGLVGSLSGITTFISGVTYERFTRKYNNQKLLVLGSFLFASGFLAYGLARSWAFILIGSAMVGFGLGFNTAHLTTWLAQEVSPEMRGRANGIFTSMRFLSEFIGSLVFAPIVLATSYSFGYLLSAVIIILMGLVTLVIRQSLSQTGVVY